MSIGDIFLERGERDKAREAWEQGYKKLGNAAFLLRIEACT
jgi:predicted negative regulator of RcsB-dependent stress response